MPSKESSVMEYNEKGLPIWRLDAQPPSAPEDPEPEEFLSRIGGGLPKVRVGGKLPPRPQTWQPPDAPEHIEDVEMEDTFSPDRQCESPVELPMLQMPIIVQGLELGLPNLNKEHRSKLAKQFGGREQPLQNRPKIYIGDDAPTPRWLIRPAATEKPAQGQKSRSRSASSAPLGKLRWEFDPGSPDTHGQDPKKLRVYAHQYLRNCLCDPIVRFQLRQSIRCGQYAETIQDVDDPLPVPPPPPHFKNQKPTPTDYVSLRSPLSAAAPDAFHFNYLNYQRPPLARRPHPGPSSVPSRESSPQAYHSFTEENAPANDQPYQASNDGSRGRASTSSSGSSNAKEYSKYLPVLEDDDHHHLKPGEYKWIWILLTVLILGMFLCLFLYVFGILR
ncbi:hypothetical protein BJY04DRAFT_168533 [Aspergillus karnatakaensis]|uniref:uncharacterized protein n=1 Tax=Aspergillus karnatakaensis TaxID=1810916 RepID=UPI003CCD4C9D